MTVHAQVLSILADATQVAPESLHDDTALDSIGLDSLGLLEVALAVRKDLDLPVDEGDLAEARTVGELIGLVEETRARVA